MEEIFKDISGYEGLYQVSNLGRIKSLSRIVLNRGKHPFVVNEKILSTPKCKGYNSIGLCKNGITKRFRLCRIVATEFLNNKENKPEVNHIDGNKSNDNVTNLEWVTKKENMQHASKNGLLKIHKGSLNCMSIKVYCVKNKIVFDTILDASKYIGLSSSHLSRVLRGIYKNNTSLIIYKNEM